MRPLHESRVLLLHPFLNFYGGAEYLLSVVAKEIVPQADIVTFSSDSRVLQEMGITENRVTSLLGKGIPAKLYRQMTPFYPSLVDTLSYDNYDLILSFSYGYVHGLVTSHTQLHVSYIQTPMRLLWLRESDFYFYDKVPVVREIYRNILAWQRVWDKQAAMRPDYLFANSKEVSNRVATFWNRQSGIIYPPVDTDFYLPSKQVAKEDYFVTHSRLVRYKRIDLIIEACREARKKLLIIGDGPDYNRLKKFAKGSQDVIFTGHVPHEEKRDLLQKAKGFLFAAHEDFGIAPIEALAAGLPVLAFGKGGVLETITPDTGVFFKEQFSTAIVNQLPIFEKFIGQVNKEVLKHQAEKFSKQRFVSQYTQEIAAKTKEFDSNGPPINV